GGTGVFRPQSSGPCSLARSGGLPPFCAARAWAGRLRPRRLAFFCRALFLHLVGWENAPSLNPCPATRRPRGPGSRGRPGLSGDGERIDPSRFPPQRLVARAVELAVVQAAERNGEFVADLATEGEFLGEAHVMRLGRLAPANETRFGSDVI